MSRLSPLRMHTHRRVIKWERKKGSLPETMKIFRIVVFSEDGEISIDRTVRATKSKSALRKVSEQIPGWVWH